MPSPNERTLIEAGYKKAKSITRTHARTFYFASHLLPKDKRYASYSIYALCRLIDDAVDEDAKDHPSLEELESVVDSIYAGAHQSDPLFAAIAKTVQKYGMEREHLKEVIAGVKMDLEGVSIQSFDELAIYCYRVAGVVGVMMTMIFGFSDPRVKNYAVLMGGAMQLTNILRDVGEDYKMGRVYLPHDELERFSVLPTDFKRGLITEPLREFLKFQIERARSLYLEAEKGVGLILGKRSRLVVLAMSRIYAAILKSIEENDYDVFKERASVGSLRKFAILLGLLFKFPFMKLTQPK